MRVYKILFFRWMWRAKMSSNALRDWSGGGDGGWECEYEWNMQTNKKPGTLSRSYYMRSIIKLMIFSRILDLQRWLPHMQSNPLPLRMHKRPINHYRLPVTIELYLVQNEKCTIAVMPINLFRFRRMTDNV